MIFLFSKFTQNVIPMILLITHRKLDHMASCNMINKELSVPLISKPFGITTIIYIATRKHMSGYHKKQ
jgi:hypothetical protein